MKNYGFQTRNSRFRFQGAVKFLVILCCCILALFFQNVGGRYALKNVSAASGDLIAVEKYSVEMTVSKTRRVYVKEQITVRFLKEYYDGEPITMFYRSLPTDGGRYYDIQASCPDNAEFSYYVADNPDISGFIDVNCVGGVAKDRVWTYFIEYAMEHDRDSGDRMIIDVIPFGFTVPLHNVSAKIHFPAQIAQTDFDLYVGFGSNQADTSIVRKLSDNGKTLTFFTDLLEVGYNARYDEYVADGVTVDFRLPKGTLTPFADSQIFTKDMWWILLVGGLCVALAILARTFLQSKRDMVTTVNIKAPDDMDPMQMGKLLDGTVDNEDVTSMLYYFAYKGYMEIDFTDEDDPILTKKREIDEREKPHAKTLFNGLFLSGNTVSVSQLKEKYYLSVDSARLQVKSIKMYENKSVFGFLSGSILGVLYATIVPLLMGLFNVGGGYTYPIGVLLGVPAIVLLVIAWVRENYRYKWRKGARTAVLAVEIAVAVIATLVFTYFFAGHLLTKFEKLVICGFAFACIFITIPALSRTEKYVDTLGEILGFKDFIVVTEEDKIKFMLEENPQLYYKILPYAQVLGVTDEWEHKFANITLSPPDWYVGAEMTVFDYYVLHRCMTRAMVTAMTRPQAEGGGRIGRSGGGGGFGGFGGGGFGGGGGGAR